jgi:hypothetical protein
MGEGQPVLRSGDPEGVMQEMWAPFAAYQAICRIVGLAVDAAGIPPDRVSFPHALAAATDTVAAFPPDRADLALATFLAKILLPGGLRRGQGLSLAFSEAVRTETGDSGVRILALCPGPVAAGYLASLGDQRATTSIIYRHTADPADVVRAGQSGFDHQAMTVIPGLRTRLMAQGHRLLPRTLMARMAAPMLAPSRAARHHGQPAGDHSTRT